MNNMKGKNLILVLLVLLLIINIAMIVTFFVFKNKKHDEKHEFFKHNKFKHKKECLVQNLNLTKEQSTKFFELRDEHKSKIFVFIDSTKSIRNSMIDELLKYENADTALLNTFPSKISEIETALQFETINYFLKVREILDKTQYEELLNNFKSLSGCKKGHKHLHHEKSCKDKKHKGCKDKEHKGCQHKEKKGCQHKEHKDCKHKH